MEQVPSGHLPPLDAAGPARLWARFVATRAAVRAGAPLWQLTDDELARKGFLGPKAFGTVQNLLSALIAAPLVIATAAGKQVLEGWWLGESSAPCDFSALLAAWQWVAPLLIAALGPVLVAGLVHRALGLRLALQPQMLRAYRYQNAAHTLAAKAGMLGAFGMLAELAALSLLMYSMFEGSGGFGFLAASESPTDELLWIAAVIGAPVLAGLALVAIPTFFYVRFLSRFPSWAARRLGGGTADAMPPGAAVWAGGAAAVLLAALLFLLSAVAVPWAGDVAKALACDDIRVPGL